MTNKIQTSLYFSKTINFNIIMCMNLIGELYVLHNLECFSEISCEVNQGSQFHTEAVPVWTVEQYISTATNTDVLFQNYH